MALLPMGIRCKNGASPFNKKAQNIIDSIFNEARNEFARIAAQEGMQIFKENVPIDTETLKDNLNVRVVSGIAVFQVPNKILHYDKKDISAKKLAIILEIGIGRSGKLLHRSKSNIAAGTTKGTPTRDWIHNSHLAILSHMSPVAKTILSKAVNKAIKAVINGQ